MTTIGLVIYQVFLVLVKKRRSFCKDFHTCIEWFISTLIEHLHPLLILRASVVSVVHHGRPLQEEVGDVLPTPSQQDLWLQSLKPSS